MKKKKKCKKWKCRKYKGGKCMCGRFLKQNVVRIKCLKVRRREWIRTDMKVIQDIQYKGKSDTEYLCFDGIIRIESLGKENVRENLYNVLYDTEYLYF